jgi:dTDP-4-amino-4,6-dideoxygalactose transaminase
VTRAALKQTFEHLQPSLIPRYNWDFGLRSLTDAVAMTLGWRKASEDALTLNFPDDPIFTTSGRASLVAILRALHLPEGAKVAVPLYCCPVVFEAIGFAGCRCEFIDINDTDYGMSPDDLRKKIAGVSAVIVVHMFGHPVDMKRIRAVTGHIPVIEDCAHSFLSLLDEIPTGWFGDASFFSFRNGKYLSVGEASAIRVREKHLRDRVEDVVAGFERWTTRQEVVHAAGSFVKSMAYRKPLYGLAGYPLGRALDAKLNLSDKTGISLRQVSQGYYGLMAKRLERFPELVERQRNVSIALLRRIRPGRIILPVEAPNVRSNFYQFPVRLPTQQDRNDLAAFLFRKGIDTARYLEDVEETARTLYGYSGGCPTAERCARTALIIPNHYTLEAEEVEKIVRAVNDWARWFSGT